MYLTYISLSVIEANLLIKLHSNLILESTSTRCFSFLPNLGLTRAQTFAWHSTLQ